MASKALWILSLVVLVAMANGQKGSSADAPAPDCMNVLMDMAPCLSFVSNDSTVNKPEDGCCSGLAKVVKENPICLCQAFQNSGSLGISINMTRAMALPTVCNVKTPPISKCSAPAPSPKPPTPSPNAPAPSPKLRPAVTPSKSPAPSGPHVEPPTEPPSSVLPSQAPSPAPGISKATTSHPLLAISFALIALLASAAISHF
ncbi:hypothetical protein AMTRI_Chr04g188780 [Amborella trichopoda]